MIPILYKHSCNDCERDSGLLLAKRLKFDIMTSNEGFPNRNNLVLNWGVSGSTYNYNFLNSPISVKKALNKLTTLKILTEARIPCLEYCENRRDVLELLRGTALFARLELEGSRGRGIKYIKPHTETIPTAKLYTVEFLKDREFRTHVIFGKIIDITEKIPSSSNPNSIRVRTLKNGWIYKRESTIPLNIGSLGLRAVRALDLEFGAVDILYNSESKEAVVCEVNTAPGIVGLTLRKYVQAFKDFLDLDTTEDELTFFNHNIYI